jgi:AcrR family transcriptional regulator
MDDIARKIAVSKKTIYQFFKDKDELISAVMKNYLTQQESELDTLYQNRIDPIDEVLKISDYIKKTLESVNTAILFEIEKYHPKSYELFQRHQETKVYGMLLENMKQGREMGLYRQDIDVEILARLRIEEIKIGCNPEIFPSEKFAAHLVHHEFMNHFIFGICTLKGHKLINKYRQVEEDLN